MSYNYLFKLIVVGACSVGKTCLVDSWCNKQFRPEFVSTIGVEFAAKNIWIDNKHIKVHIWDTAGQEKFASIISTYYRGCAGAFLVFDVSRRKSFNKLNFWINEIKNNNSTKEDIPMIIIGTKTDKENRTVSREEGEAFAKSCGYGYIETSSKNNINTQESFELLIKKVNAKINDTDDKMPLPQGVREGAIKSKKKDNAEKTLRYCEDNTFTNCCCIN